MTYREHRNKAKSDEAEALFVEDCPHGGGCIISCGYCEHIQPLTNIKCEECGKFFLLRPWWNW